RKERLKPFFTGILTLGMLLGIGFAQTLQATIITMEVSNKNIIDVVQEIQQKTNLKFVYNPDLLGKEKFSKRTFVNEKVENVFHTLGYSAVEEGSRIIVKRRASNVSSSQQTITVTGTIKDDLGDELIGVSILLKDTNIGTSTDINGK